LLIVDRVLGNRHEDPDLAEECERAARAGGLETVRLSSQDVQRGRLRISTDAGTDLGLNLGREVGVRDGDVLYHSPDGRRIVVVAVKGAEAVVIRPAPSPEEALGGSPGNEGLGLFELGVRLGHLLGNQHWPIRLEQGTVLVPVATDRKAVETVLRTYGLEGLEWKFTEVSPETRLPTIAPPISHSHA
jgi:urease accessory protein